MKISMKVKIKGAGLIPPKYMKRIRKTNPKPSNDKDMYPSPSGELKWEPGGFDEFTMKGIRMSGGKVEDPRNTLYYSYMVVDDKSSLVGYLYIPSIDYSTVSIYTQGENPEEGRGSRNQYIGSNDKDTRSTIRKLKLIMEMKDLKRLGFVSISSSQNDIMIKMMNNVTENNTLH